MLILEFSKVNERSENVEIKNLKFRYTIKDEYIFNGLNWKLDEEHVHFIIGENGSGKTTLYEIIAGLLKYEGEIINGIQPEKILLQLQGVPMLKTMKGKDLAELVLGAGGENTKISLEYIKSNFPITREDKLAYLWQATYGNMSIGERRWLLIYLFCLLERELYIFDEPTAGLDITSAYEILEMIVKLSTIKNKRVLLTTHRMEEMSYFDQYTVTVLKNGKNYFTGSKSAYAQATNLII